MANVPDHNNPAIKESVIKVFRQKYYVVDDEQDTGRRTDYELRENRVEVIADDEGVFIESKEGMTTEALSIATPELAVRIAKHILEAYGEEEKDELLQVGEIKFLIPELQNCVAHELWRLENHCRSPHGPVDAHGAYELLNHLEAIAKYLDIKPAPHPDK